MTTTMAEPEWDDDTRELALGYDGVSICPLCGRPTFICQDPELGESWVADAPVRCHAHTAVLARQKTVTEESNPQSAALLWRAHLEGGGRGGRS